MAAESLPPRIAEKAALAVAQTLPGEKIVCTSTGRGQAARGLWRDRSTALVTLCYLDQFQQQLTLADHAAEQATTQTADTRLSIVCACDLPEIDFDLAVIPCSVRGEAELQRDWLQQAYARLVSGGRLVAAVDNATDRWLHEQMQQLGPKVSVSRREDAVVYVVIKDKPLRRLRKFDCEFTFRDSDRTVTAYSRPGVFSHRRLDPGAHALLDAVSIKGGDRIIDIGCGCGAVGLALAMRTTDAQVLAIDSNVRAIQCTAKGAAKNELKSVATMLTCEGACDQPQSYDVAVCNPPYYSNFRIAKLFIEAARHALRPGGRVYVVTKHPDWYEQNMYPGWRDTTAAQGKQYAIITAIRG